MKIKKMNKVNSKGFTLIELLIVIIIIGILAAIAFVAYSGSQNKATEAAAESTLAEIKTKLGEYNADNGNYPATQAALDTWLASAAGGNNATLSTTFGVTANFTYTPNDGNGNSCNDTTTTCAAYTIVAIDDWSGTSNITQTN